MLPQDAINEFKQIYQDEYGVELSDQEASERAYKFLRLFKMIYQPIPDKWLEEKADK